MFRQESEMGHEFQQIPSPGLFFVSIDSKGFEVACFVSMDSKGLTAALCRNVDSAGVRELKRLFTDNYSIHNKDRQQKKR